MAEPITNVLGIVGMENKGAYDANAYYEKLNVVSYQGSSYCALDSVHNVLPTNTTKWQLIAEKGDKGDTGPIGTSPVRGVDYWNASDIAAIESDLSDDVAEEVRTQIGSLTSATPLVASSTAEMTDTSRIYVNTSDGKWYYYNGESWEIGGTYQATEVPDGSITPEKTNFVDTKHINHFKVSERPVDWHGVTFDRDIEAGKIEIDGTCTENTNFKLGGDLDYFIDAGQYVFDLNVISGSLSSGVGISIFGLDEDNQSVTLLNTGSENLPATITLNKKVKLTSFNLWTVTGRVYDNYLVFPQFQKNSIVKPVPHNLYDFKNSYLKEEIPNILQDFLDEKNITEILIPSNIRYLPNKELSFYYSNLLYNATDKEIYNHQSYNNFIHYDNCYRFKKTDVRTYWEKMIFNKNDINKTQVSKNVNLIGVNTNAGNGVTKKCLFIGDSLTNLGYYTQELLNLFENDVMNIELLGTMGTGLNKHEGRNNWSAYSYTHEATYTGLSNPFWNSNNNSFDFTKYMNDNNYSSVDIVSIGLGTNDRGVIGSTATEFKNNLQTMIDSIKEFNSNIKIMILLPPPICYVGKDNVLWNMSIKVANKTIIDNFDNKQSQNIYVVATGLNVDPVYDYTMTTIPINDRSSITKTVVNDAVHPDVIGFEHIADVIYPTLKYLGSL